MNEDLYQLPDGVTVSIDDNAKAQSLMLYLGVWDDISKQASLTTTVTMCVADTHPTHWCLCVRHWNNPDPSENGFQVIAYPKDSVDRLAVESIRQQYLSDSTEITSRPINYKPWN